jgi:hypothetical protein
MVDIYEARLSHRRLDFGPPGLNYRDKVKYILTKWRAVSPLRIELYMSWLETFETEAGFLSGSTLPNIPDEGIVAIPTGCEIQQVAIQLSDSDLGTSYTRYTINKDLWDLMDDNSKAALILHELIFREAITAQHRVSLRVRYLNAILLSDSTSWEYFEASKNLDGLFLEWGWAGFERSLTRGNSLRASWLSEDKVHLEFRVVQSWCHNESVDIVVARTKNIEGVWQKDFHKSLIDFPLNAANDSPALGRFHVSSIQGKFRFGNFEFEGDGRKLEGYFSYNSQEIMREFILKQLEGIKVQINAYYGAKYVCEHLSGVELKHEEIKFQSEAGQGICTLVKKENDKTIEQNWKSFYKLKISDYINVNYMKVQDYDGTKSLSFKIQDNMIQCEQVELQSLQYICSGLPQSIKCGLPVHKEGSLEILEHVDGILNLKDQIHIVNPTFDSDHYVHFQILLPQGETVGFTKGFWSNTPDHLSKDSWRSMRLSAVYGTYCSLDLGAPTSVQ